MKSEDGTWLKGYEVYDPVTRNSLEWCDTLKEAAYYAYEVIGDLNLDIYYFDDTVEPNIMRRLTQEDIEDAFLIEEAQARLENVDWSTFPTLEEVMKEDAE